MSPALPPAVIRLYSKRGPHDCAIASLASYTRIDYEGVLIAAAKVAPKCWESGLDGPELIRVARRLGFTMRWREIGIEEVEEATGCLCIRYHDDASKQHMVLIVDGAIYENEHDPVSRWEPEAYLRFYNAYPTQILEMVE